LSSKKLFRGEDTPGDFLGGMRRRVRKRRKVEGRPRIRYGTMAPRGKVL